MQLSCVGQRFSDEKPGLQSASSRGQVWSVIWAVALAWSWLLPNHYPPWATFHAEIWAAICIVAAGLVVSWQAYERVQIGLAGLALLCSTLLVCPQYWSGQFAFSGQAWVAFAYLGLAALSFCLGRTWESWKPLQLPDALALAVGGAAILSVGVQLDQWLQQGQLIVWGMGGGEVRPYANLGQPNLLSTFLVWGVLAVFWGVHRLAIGPVVATLASLYLLFGIALTQSRTGWLEILVVVLAMWHWRRMWRWKALPWISLVMFAYLMGCVFATESISGWLSLSPPPQLDGRLAVASDLRISAWKLLTDASFARPWLGYGWGNINDAQIQVALEHEPLHSKFGHAHNLLLDIVLGIGWPMGLMLIGALALWLWQRVKGIGHAADAILLLFIVVAGLHAMLELPLHHAHFLMPLCLLGGALEARQEVGSSNWSFPVRWLRGGVIASAVVCALLVSDYLRVEASYARLRFEWARLSQLPPGGPPEVLILNQFHEYIAFLRFSPAKGMSEKELIWARNVAQTFPSPLTYAKYAAALALNGKGDEAELRQKQICAISEEVLCTDMRRAVQATVEAMLP